MIKYSKKCPRCGNYDLSIHSGEDGYVYHAICKYCQCELTLEERLKIKVLNNPA